jgi:uncharacterized protein (TIGR02246 family)
MQTTTAMKAGLSDQDRRVIQELYPAFRKHAIDRDFARLVELYTDDAVVLPPNHPVIRGREAIAGYMATFPPVAALRFEVDEIDGRDDVAYVIGRYEMTLLPPDRQQPVHDRGKFIEIRLRQPDGRWLLHRDTFNSDLPPAQPQT